MIPDRTQIVALWEKYDLPGLKRTHVLLVARVAVYLANEVMKVTNTQINMSLLEAAAMLHDIDKSIQKLPNEHHPDTAVRVLQEGGMEEVAALVRTHTLPVILDQKLSPKTWEEKLLYLADKMVKYEIITVDGRFALWRQESLPPKALAQLDACYPKVKKLEQEIFTLIGKRPEDIKGLAPL